MVKIKSVVTGKQVNIDGEWDGVLSMSNGRAWYSCPVCGLGVSSKLGTTVAHKDCLEAVKK